MLWCWQVATPDKSAKKASAVEKVRNLGVSVFDVVGVVLAWHSSDILEHSGKLCHGGSG